MESISAGGDRAKNGQDADDARSVSAAAAAVESAAAAAIESAAAAAASDAAAVAVLAARLSA
jgi:hypothetical protein